MLVYLSRERVLLERIFEPVCSPLNSPALVGISQITQRTVSERIVDLPFWHWSGRSVETKGAWQRVRDGRQGLSDVRLWPYLRKSARLSLGKDGFTTLVLLKVWVDALTALSALLRGCKGAWHLLLALPLSGLAAGCPTDLSLPS